MVCDEPQILTQERVCEVNRASRLRIAFRKARRNAPLRMTRGAVRALPSRRLFVDVGDLQDPRFSPVRSDDLQSDGKARLGEAAGD